MKTKILLVLLMASSTAASLSGVPHEAAHEATPRPAPHIVCQEDEWCWNALLMGNHEGRYYVGQERPA